MDPDKPPRLVGIKQAAVYLNISRWTLRHWINQGKIPYVQFPGLKQGNLRGAKVDLNDLDAFIEQNKQRLE